MKERQYKVHPNIIQTLGADYASLYLQRRDLLKKIKVIRQRLSIGYSEPLHDYLKALMKEDTQLLCQMIDLV